MARRLPPGTRVPGADVLIAADALNAAHGAPTDQLGAAAEAEFAKHHTIHLAGSGCPDAPLENYGGSSTASIIAVFDHPAMCPTCVKGRAKVREKGRHLQHQPALRPHLAFTGARASGR